jgi:hypothetical protein
VSKVGATEETVAPTNRFLPRDVSRSLFQLFNYLYFVSKLTIHMRVFLLENVPHNRV